MPIQLVGVIDAQIVEHAERCSDLIALLQKHDREPFWKAQMVGMLMAMELYGLAVPEGRAGGGVEPPHRET